MVLIKKRRWPGFFYFTLHVFIGSEPVRIVVPNTKREGRKPVIYLIKMINVSNARYPMRDPSPWSKPTTTYPRVGQTVQFNFTVFIFLGGI